MKLLWLANIKAKIITRLIISSLCQRNIEGITLGCNWINAILIEPHLITSCLEICSFLVSASTIDRCVVPNLQLTITFCYDRNTLIAFCLEGLYRLVTFCATMNIFNLYGYYVCSVRIFTDIWILIWILSWLDILCLWLVGCIILSWLHIMFMVGRL